MNHVSRLVKIERNKYVSRYKLPGIELRVQPNQINQPGRSALLYIGHRAPRWPFLILGLHHDEIFSKRWHGLEITIYGPGNRSHKGPDFRLDTPWIRGRRLRLGARVTPAEICIIPGIERDMRWHEYHLPLRIRAAIALGRTWGRLTVRLAGDLMPDISAAEFFDAIGMGEYADQVWKERRSRPMAIDFDLGKSEEPCIEDHGERDDA